jgi:beta-1,4-mannooligosaccharide/beta-1,4-mannosyl-N-acetylglucosamine phosphorylase
MGSSCNSFVYSFGAALLDLDEPWKVIVRGDNYLLAPQAEYERTGDVPNVAFPCAALTDPEKRRIAIYYGGADTVTCLAFGYIDEIIQEIKAHPHR